MAKRLATVYVKTCLILTEAEMSRFLQMIAEHQVVLKVKVCENGNQEVVIQADAGEELVLTFERMGGQYVCKGSCQIRDAKLTNIMRKAVAAFKGDAVVHRIYTGYTIAYYYERGSVSKITELSGRGEKVIFERKDSLGEMQRLFSSRRIETEIGVTRMEINALLDLRNHVRNQNARKRIDERLQRLSHKLFVLEA